MEGDVGTIDVIAIWALIDGLLACFSASLFGLISVQLVVTLVVFGACRIQQLSVVCSFSKPFCYSVGVGCI